jgi:hypothetical protein
MSWYSTRSRAYRQLWQLTFAAAGAAALISGSAVAYGAVPRAIGSAPTTVAFAFTGSPQSFTVPASVTSLTLTATGAAGGPGWGVARRSWGDSL